MASFHIYNEFIGSYLHAHYFIEVFTVLKACLNEVFLFLLMQGSSIIWYNNGILIFYRDIRCSFFE
jgi:hypothetical protein